MFYSIGWYVRKSDLKKMFKAFDFVFTFEIPDNSVDMTFADPPFNLGKKYNNYKDKKKVDEYQVPYLFTIFPNDLFILHLGKTLLPTHYGIQKIKKILNFMTFVPQIQDVEIAELFCRIMVEKRIKCILMVL
jgi:DNA modification methylase